MLGIDLNSSKWCDMVFEGKDRQYGGYQLRRSVALRQLIAYLVVITLLLMAVFVPRLFVVQQVQQPAEELVYDETQVEITSIDELDIKSPADELAYIETTPPPPLRSSIKYTVPVITADDVADEELLKTQDELLQSPISISFRDIVGEDVEGAVEIAEFQELVGDVDMIFEEAPQYEVDQLPQFPGGEVALMQYLGNNLKYPKAAADKKIHGQVVVRFVITESGEVGEMQVMRTSNKLLNEAVFKVLREMPRWVPGKKNGEPVAMWFAMPINFVLRHNSDKD